MMTKALLTLSIGNKAKGGVEVFSEYLKRVFDDLVVIDYNSASRIDSMLSRSSLPYLDEQRQGMVIAKEFLRRHQESPFELVFSNGSYGWYLTSIDLDIPMINIFHGTWVGCNQWLSKELNGISKELAIRIGGLYGRGIFEKISGLKKHCISVSLLVKDELKRYYGIESEVILNCVDTDFFMPMDKEECRKRLKLPKDKKIGFFPGGMTLTKGLDIILRLAERHKKILFILACQDKEGKIDNVMKVSSLPFGEMPIYYNAADFCIFPSRYEACALAPIEALSCNIPVITSKTGVFFDDKYNDLARVVPTFNLEDYSKAIEEVLDERVYNSREKIKEDFSFDIFSKRYRDYVARILGMDKGVL